MLYLTEPMKVQSRETQIALNAADGYLYFKLLDEALEELEKIPKAEKEDPPVMLARVRLLLYKKEWRQAEHLSAQGSDLHPRESEFTVQCAFALRHLHREKKAEEVLREAPNWILLTGVIHYNLACYEARLGDLNVARLYIDEAIKINAGIKKSAKIDPDLQALWN